MNIKIIKFGGDALSTLNNQLIASNIIKSYSEKIIVVASAMGKAGFPYSTDNLNMLIENKYISKKEYARLLSLGEIISTIRLSYVFNKEGIKTYALSIKEIDLLCKGDYLNAEIDTLNINKINELFKQYDCLICPGFIGLNNDFEHVLLGRNSSDYTAISLAKFLNINEVTLYKSVDGIYHTPPMVYKNNKKYRFISYDEMLSLNSIGFNVVMEKAVQLAKETSITISVKSFLDNDKEGSIISSTSSNDLILGYNILDKEVEVASFYPCEVKSILEEAFLKRHIFISNESISENKFTFSISKSVNNLIKTIINEQISKNYLKKHEK